MTRGAKILAAVITFGIFVILAAVVGDSTRKDGDTLRLSTVKWGEVESSVPEPIMREMGLEAGQEIDDETARDLTDRIVKYFKLEAKWKP